MRVARLTLAFALLAVGAPGRADAQAPADEAPAPRTDDEASEDGPPDDESPEDGTREDRTPEDGTPEDGASADEAPEDEGTDPGGPAPGDDAPPDTISIDRGAADTLSEPTAAVTAPEGYDALQRVERPRRPRSTVHLDVLSLGERDLTLHVQMLDVAEPSVDHCTAPCALELPRGRYRFQIQPRGGGPRDADGGAHYLSGERVAVQMSYDHRIGLRSLGWTLFNLAGTTLGLSYIGGLFGLLVFGLPIAAAFLIPAIPLIFLGDSARVQVTPIPLQ